MIRLFNFYHLKTKNFFLSSLLLILTSYFAKYVFQLTIPESRWDRLPILLSVLIAVILTWRINQLDTQSTRRTLASTANQSTLEKIGANIYSLIVKLL